MIPRSQKDCMPPMPSKVAWKPMLDVTNVKKLRKKRLEKEEAKWQKSLFVQQSHWTKNGSAGWIIIRRHCWRKTLLPWHLVKHLWRNWRCRVPRRSAAGYFAQSCYSLAEIGGRKRSANCLTVRFVKPNRKSVQRCQFSFWNIVQNQKGYHINHFFAKGTHGFNWSGAINATDGVHHRDIIEYVI